MYGNPEQSSTECANIDRPSRTCKRLALLVSVLVVAAASSLAAATAHADVTFSAYAPGINFHAIGIRHGKFAWSAPQSAGAGFVTYGPYSDKFRDGVYQAKFRLSVEDNQADDLIVGYVDIYDDAKNLVVARRDIHRKEFSGADSLQDFSLTYPTWGVNKLEFRVFSYGTATVTHASTVVTRLSAYSEINLNPLPPTNINTVDFKAGTENANLQVYRAKFGTHAAGNYAMRVRLAIDDNEMIDLPVVTLEVEDLSKKSVLAKMSLDRSDFLAPRKPQVFELPFEYDGSGELEFSVYGRYAKHVQHLSTSVVPILPSVYKATDSLLSHQVGSAVDGTWLGTKADGQGYLTSGPNTRRVPPGIATITFSLTIDDNSKDNDPVARLDAYDSKSGVVLARRLVKRRDFKAPHSPQSFDLLFEISNLTTLEFRVFTYGNSELGHGDTVVNPDRLTLAALWKSQTHWEFRKRNVFTSHGVQDYATSTLVALDGIWYAFNRAPAEQLDSGQFKSCVLKKSPPLQIVVRSSTDHAGTWSEPVVIAAPSASPSAQDYCEITDGGAYFDAETDTWHYLAQCVNPPADWSLCHYTRGGISPMGIFEADPANPVVIGGQLWAKICKGQGKACPATMKDEGTPQILGKSSDGFFYVTFHGANYGATVTGARGVARTADFITWNVSGDGLPDDAILTPNDCKDWNAGWGPSGCIGEGDARILRSNGEYYLLTEAADQSLNCRSGQKWVFGLLRNSTLGASGSWQNFPGNPVIVDTNYPSVGCDLEYMNFIRDRGEIFLEFSLYTPDYPFPNYIFQLVDGSAANVMRVK